MAERRMFSRSVVGSDRFLDLPATAQNLYFQLGLAADDDGFVSSPKTIARMVGAGQADLQTLCEKGFLLSFPSDVVVITHWKLNNSIRADRRKKTIFTAEKSLLKTAENMAYFLDDNQMTTNWQPSDNQAGDDRLPQVRSGEDSRNIHAHSDEVREGEISKKTVQKRNEEPQSNPLFDRFWEAYPRKRDKPKALRVWNRLHPDESLLEIMLQAIGRQRQSPEWQRENGQYIPYPASYLNGRRWEDEEVPAQEEAVPACWREN